MNNSKLLISGALVLLSVVACTRNADKPAQLKFDLPKFSKSVSGKSTSAQAQSNDGFNSSLNPTTLSQINCYALFVAKPDGNSSACGVKDEATNIFSPTFSFEFAKYLIPAGTQAEITVPSGPGRTIYLVGLVAGTGADGTTGVSCSLAPNGGDVDTSNLSVPMVLGSVTSDLTPGENELNITAALNPDAHFDDCYFSGTDGIGGEGSGGGNNGPYLRLEQLHAYEYGENTSAREMSKGLCYKSQLKVFQPCSGGGACTEHTLVNDLNVNFPSASNELNFYNTAEDCQNGSNVSSISLLSGSTYSDIWLSSPVGSAMTTLGSNIDSYITMDANTEGITFDQFTRSTLVFDEPVIVATGTPAALYTGVCSTGVVTFELRESGGVHPVSATSSDSVFARNHVYTVDMTKVGAYGVSDTTCSLTSTTSVVLDTASGVSVGHYLKKTISGLGTFLPNTSDFSILIPDIPNL